MAERHWVQTVNMCSSARLKVDFKSPEVNSRYQRKVDKKWMLREH